MTKMAKMAKMAKMMTKILLARAQAWLRQCFDELGKEKNLLLKLRFVLVSRIFYIYIYTNSQYHHNNQLKTQQDCQTSFPLSDDDSISSARTSSTVGYRDSFGENDDGCFHLLERSSSSSSRWCIPVIREIQNSQCASSSWSMTITFKGQCMCHFLKFIYRIMMKVICGAYKA